VSPPNTAVSETAGGSMLSLPPPREQLPAQAPAAAAMARRLATTVARLLEQGESLISRLVVVLAADLERRKFRLLALHGRHLLRPDEALRRRATARGIAAPSTGRM